MASLLWRCDMLHNGTKQFFVAMAADTQVMPCADVFDGTTRIRIIVWLHATEAARNTQNICNSSQVTHAQSCAPVL